MAKNKISEYSSTASQNTDIGNININEGCAPSNINNAIRELMAQVKDFQQGAEGDGLTVSTLNATTATVGSLSATVLSANSFGAITATSATLTSPLLVASGGTGLTTITGLVKGSGSALTTVTAPSGDVVGTTDTQTLTNKTFTGYTETVYTISDSGSVDLNPANGTIQLWTLGDNRSPTASSFAAGQSVTLMIDDGTDYTITWPSVTWKTNGGNAPTLATSGFTVIVLWKVGTTIYGARVGDA